MTNLEARPAEIDAAPPSDCGPTVQLLEEREVPLGGIRAMQVRRTLPQRVRSTVGAWCFLDAFGPSGVPMTVLPHPHIGLQTVTWPMAGQIRHRDSLGNDLPVRPGELNLMTAGTGIAHSEISAEGVELAGVQLWAALPDGVIEPAFEHVADLPRISGSGWSGIVLVGAVGAVASPATVHTPLLGLDLTAEAGARVELPADPLFEHALLVVEGEARVDGEPIPAGPLAFLGMQRDRLSLQVGPAGARMLLLGGEPFTQPIVMFWNFVGRDHDEVATARVDWEADARLPLDDPRRRFGTVPGHGTDRIPAPVLPGARLKPRARPPGD